MSTTSAKVVPAGFGCTCGECTSGITLCMTSDRLAFTENNREVPAGTTVRYLCHVIGGGVRVRFKDGGVDVMNAHAFPQLRER